ncbi:hypothetical protein BB14905_18825, partial [Bacillus sp. B14905]
IEVVVKNSVTIAKNKTSFFIFILLLSKYVIIILYKSKIWNVFIVN